MTATRQWCQPTGDNDLGAAGIAVPQVAAGADVDASFSRLDAGEVQFLAWRGDTEVTLHVPPTLHLGDILASPPAHLEPPNTLSPALGTLGEGPPVFSCPVVIEGGVAGGLAPQGDGAALGHCGARRVDTDGQRDRGTHWDTGLAPH